MAMKEAEGWKWRIGHLARASASRLAGPQTVRPSKLSSGPTWLFVSIWHDQMSLLKNEGRHSNQHHDQLGRPPPSNRRHSFSFSSSYSCASSAALSQARAILCSRRHQLTPPGAHTSNRREDPLGIQFPCRRSTGPFIQLVNVDRKS